MASKKKTTAPLQEECAYMYVGPTVHGLIQQNTIYCGTRADILKRLETAIKQKPAIKRLIVRDSDIVKAVNAIRKGEAPYAYAYNKITE